jgi:microcystin-dependent protein
MSGPAYPTILQQPFAYAGLKNIISYPSASPNASWHDGFPPVTMEPISSGGVPPAGQDFNGIYYELSSVLVYSNAGGRFKWDSSFASAVGYPIGAVIASNDFSHSFQCLTAGASSDPNTFANVDNVDWAVWGGGNTACAGNYAIDTGGTNAFVIATIPGTAQLYRGMRFAFKASTTSTTAGTLDVGSGTHPLVRNDGSAVQAGDIVSGVIYECFWDAATTSFVLVNPVPSQYSVTPASSVPVAAILPFGGSSAPSGFLLCDGSAVSRATYAALFTAISTTYGAGDGSLTFNVPNMGGNFPIGHNGSYALGASGGSAQALIAHVHVGPSIETADASAEGAPGYVFENGHATPSSTGNTGAVSGTATTATSLPPYVTVNFIIKT